MTAPVNVIRHCESPRVLDAKVRHCPARRAAWAFSLGATRVVPPGLARFYSESPLEQEAPNGARIVH